MTENKQEKAGYYHGRLILTCERCKREEIVYIWSSVPVGDIHFSHHSKACPTCFELKFVNQKFAQGD